MTNMHEPLIVEYIFQALDLAGDVVQDTIESVNMIIPKLILPLESRTISATPYNRYADIHFTMLALKSGTAAVSYYYAALQSFATDFSMYLPQMSKESIESNRQDDQLRKAINLNNGRLSQYDLCLSFFIKLAELNPYMMFMRGHLSAYTVEHLAISTLQFSLATELLHQTAMYGKTSLVSTYQRDVMAQVHLILEQNKEANKQSSKL